MNGAEALARTLAMGGAEVCFMNPGTSEIHLVAALDRVRELRAVPCLFEGVATGAADGFARMAGKPACTLFHLGPGLSNALANLHNAYRAHVPMVNIVGDHATYHRRYDAPLTSDIEALARPLSAWLRSSKSASEVSRDGADAIAAARAGRGKIATLIVPADAAWGEAGGAATLSHVAAPVLPHDSSWRRAAEMLREPVPGALLLGPHLTEGAALQIAGRIAAATGATLLAPFAFTRMARGAGRPVVQRVPYVTADAVALLRAFRRLVLVGTGVPAAFFAHPDQPSALVDAQCVTHLLAAADEDCEGALDALANELVASRAMPKVHVCETRATPRGPITVAGLAATVAALLPADAIVVDESITSGRGMMAAADGAPQHDWLVNTGGSIGIGLPLAVGAAIACPERPVLCLEADGSALYTLQALWTAAREGLKITTVIFANRAYNILKGELAGLGGNPGRRSLDVLELARPDIDFVALAKGLGMAAMRVATLDEFAVALHRGLQSAEPNLIEVPL